MKYYNVWLGKKIVEYHVDWNEAEYWADWWMGEGTDDEVRIIPEEDIP